MPNRLAFELSPYLLQHAHNPVDWYPWGDEAFGRARAEDKPLLVSIGYSSCHWCHVMERESFEDEATAALMNELFVNVKVDREERPDVDGIYMSAVQGISGRGGWPMTVFLLPDGKPFYGGTYYPPEDRGGMPGFKKVLLAISEAYQQRRDDVTTQAETITSFIRQQAGITAPVDSLDSTILDGAARTLINAFDAIHGGFGGAPKFPQAMSLEFLLRYHHRTGNGEALAVTEYTLRKMVSGGMYDQLGGGFHRYSVDDRWLVPHFEKMLYDNALLARAYLHAYQVTGHALYRTICEETLDYALAVMQEPRGGFYSAQDADSEGKEGEFYLWTPDEIASAVGSDDAPLVIRYFGVREPGQVEGKSVLTRPADPAVVAADIGITIAELDERLDRARARMLAVRSRRVPPATDDKILCAWNALMLRTLSEAARALDHTGYRHAAIANAEFLTSELWRGGRLLRSFRGRAADIPGYLEDYGAAADGLLALYQATFDPRWFRAAQEIVDAMLDGFWDETAQVLHDTPSSGDHLIARPKDRWDNATPSGTSLACSALLRLWAYTGDARYESVARAELSQLAGLFADHALGFGELLSVLDFYLTPTDGVAIVGPLTDPRTTALLEVMREPFLPNAVTAAGDPTNPATLEAIPLLEDRPLRDGVPAAYVCHGFICAAPVTAAADLAAQLPIRARRE
jgi:uncharacterized protein YyaL (SSP411 family)